MAKQFFFVIGDTVTSNWQPVTLTKDLMHNNHTMCHAGWYGGSNHALVVGPSYTAY